MRGRTSAVDNGTAALLGSFAKVWVLHFAAGKGVASDDMLGKLQARGFPIAAPALQRLLLRMSRNGWLKVATPAAGRRRYSLTSQGRESLRLARNSLRDFLPVWDAQNPSHFSKTRTTTK